MYPPQRCTKHLNILEFFSVMEKRVSFKSKKTRDLFFKNVLGIHKFNRWKDLILKFKIPRKTLEGYRNGRLTLPETFYNQIIPGFDEESLIYFKKNIFYLDSNWGRVKGGRITYSKYKKIFDKGRIKGMKFINKNRVRIPRFDTNLFLSKELSYFIGLFIGDGFTNKYWEYYLTQFTGDKNKEKVYYEKIISPISEKLFGFLPKIKEEIKTNTLRVNFYSKDLFLLITNRFKIKTGRKSKTVLIPEEILNSNEDILLSCIAGIYDAEGCFYFDNRKSYKFPYPAIALHMNNPQLIQQISNIFLRNKIKHSYTSNYSTLYIYGKEDVSLFLSKIKLLNPKYTPKIEMLKKI